MLIASPACSCLGVGTQRFLNALNVLLGPEKILWFHIACIIIVIVYSTSNGPRMILVIIDPPVVDTRTSTPCLHSQFDWCTNRR